MQQLEHQDQSNAPQTPISNVNRGTYPIAHSFDVEFIAALNSIHRKYGSSILAVHGIAHKNLDIVTFSEEFFRKSSACVSDISADDNANVSEINISHYMSESSKALHKLSGLHSIFNEIHQLYGLREAKICIEKLITGELFFHDLSMTESSYCFGFSLLPLVYEGMSFFKGNFNIRPPKHASSFIALVIQSIAYISNQIAGAAALPDFFPILDYFYRKEHGPTYTTLLRQKNPLSQEIINHFQNLIYSLNFPFRGAGQSAFTNLSVLDRGFLRALFTSQGHMGSDLRFPDNTTLDVESTLELSKFFFEYYQEIIGKEGIFTFPVVTIALSLDAHNEFIDQETVQWEANINSQKSLANVYIDQPNSFSSCCRLKNDVTKVGQKIGYQNSFGVSGVSVGSHRVVGLNLAQISVIEKDNPDIFAEDLESVHKILRAHRHLVKRHIEEGRLPLYTTGWMSLSRQYSTVGFIGLWEYHLNKGNSPLNKKSLDASVQILKFIESKIQEWQTAEASENSSYNIEQVPAESMAVRLAKIDSMLGFNPLGLEIYSNQYIPLTQEVSISERLKIQGIFDQYSSGGAIAHINIDDALPLSPKQHGKILDYARKVGAKYLGINHVFAKCAKGHYWIGKETTCPECSCERVENYTRVVGFLTKVSAWNRVRRTVDFPNRCFLNNKDAISFR